MTKKRTDRLRRRRTSDRVVGIAELRVKSGPADKLSQMQKKMTLFRQWGAKMLLDSLREVARRRRLRTLAATSTPRRQFMTIAGNIDYGDRSGFMGLRACD